MHAVLDESFAAFGLEAVLRELILPALMQVGREWEQGSARGQPGTSRAT